MSKILIDITPIDNLDIKFYRETEVMDSWGCYTGPNWIEGVGGFGKTPLLALADLINNIGKFEGIKTDNKKIFIR